MKKVFLAMLVIGCIGLLFFPGCKKSDEADGTQYILTVTTNEGVSGTPTAGTHTYDENAVVSYNYSVGSGYKGLTVTLDGATVAASGSITMTGNHTLVATAESYDARGDWSGTAWQPSGDSDFKCKFRGEILSGTVQGRIMEVSGNWKDGDFTVTNGNQIEFDLWYYDGTARFVFSGTITDDNLMSGTWEWYENDELQMSGGWELARDE